MSKNKTIFAKRGSLSFASLNSSFDEIYLQNDFFNLRGTSKTGNPKKDALDLTKKSGNRKGSIFYMAHSYPTKVPVEDVMSFIVNNTKVGDTVLDPFCGSGMSGLAAYLSGRNAIVSDIGSLALHLSVNHVRNCNPTKLQTEAKRILTKLTEIKNEYTTVIDGNKCEINYIVMSETVNCPKCKKVSPVWDFIVGKDLKTKSEGKCPKCKCVAKTSLLDKNGVVPVLVNYRVEGSKKLINKVLSASEREKFIFTRKVSSPVDHIKVDSDREMYIRCALHLHNIKNVSDFYSRRNLSALTRLFEAIQEVGDQRIRAALLFAFTNTAWHGSKMRRYNSGGGHRPLTGTLYIPQLMSEGNVYNIFENKVETLFTYYSELERLSSNATVKINRTSAVSLNNVKSGSVDYIFTDPPFGSNIFYADCNILAEAWLGSLTNVRDEAVVNKSLKKERGGKSLTDYQALIEGSFKEMVRVLRPDGKIHLVFNNTDGKVWSCLVEAIRNAGLAITNTILLDKVQKSFKGNKSAYGKENVSTTDIIFELSPAKNKTQKNRKKEAKSADKVLEQIWTNFNENDLKTSDSKFIVADFYSYLIQHCAGKDVDPSVLDYDSVKRFIDEAA